MRRYVFLLIILASIAGTVLCEAGPKKAAAEAKKRKEAELRQIVETSFPRWDRNHDGILSLEEINALIESPQVRGDEAAAVVILHQRFAPKGEESGFQGLSLIQLMAFADDREAVRSFSKQCNRIQSINHALFLAGDPNLQTFHQGGVGDCYLLSVVGAFVARDPQAMRNMIKLLPDGGYEIHFGSGKVVKVSPVTDAELVMGAKEGSDHGIWLSVLEKAYASIREEKRETQSNKPIDDDDAVAKDLLGGGKASPVISLLTGHKAATTSIARWAKEDSKQAVKQLDNLLGRLMRERKLAAIGTGKDSSKQLPKHIPHGHVFGVIGYDSTRQIVRVFNPWGNDVTPEGTPGLVNGYFTRDGIFEMPVSDFVQIFGRLAYETDELAD
ncbi:MAG: C2 family cysteine protease [Limisphaerales bacterium]